MLRMRVRDYPGGTFRSHFAAKLDQKYYERMTAERTFRNRFFMTVVIRPTANATDKLMEFLPTKQADKNATIADTLELLDDRNSVMKGKRGSIGLELGGRLRIKKK